MGQNLKISVIIPTYNNADTISRCVKSIFNQNYDNYEMLIIDDGSTDGTYEQCQKLITNHKNAFLFNQSNSGVSVARNLGISKANGDYICFLDADDTYMQDAFSNGMALAQGSIDIVMGGIRQIDISNKDIIANADFSGSEHYRVYQQKELTKLKRWVMERDPDAFPELPTPVNVKGQQIENALRMGSVSGKFYRTDVIKKTKFIANLGYSEDLVFSYECFDNIKTFLISDEVLYNYYVNAGSVTQKVFNEHAIRDGLILSDILVRIAHDYDNTFEQFILRKIVSVFLMSVMDGILSNLNWNLHQQYRAIRQLMNNRVYRRTFKKMNKRLNSKKYAVVAWLGQFRCAGILLVAGKLMQVRKK